MLLPDSFGVKNPARQPKVLKTCTVEWGTFYSQGTNTIAQLTLDDMPFFLGLVDNQRLYLIPCSHFFSSISWYKD